MNTKRIVRWVIVLFLLAALPGLTVALAQGQEPAAKQPLPPVTEPGESAAPAFNVYETEPNNTMGQADVMNINDVMGGYMNYGGDVDFFKFYNPDYLTHILIDVDADTIDADMDPVVTFYDAAGNQLGVDDDSSGTVDPLLYRILDPGWWYVKVEDYYDDGGGNQWYDLIVSYPFLISAAAANLGTGNVAGIPFRSEDILAWSPLNDGAEKWVMLIDGSDVGFTKNVTNLSRGWLDHVSSNLAVSFAANVTVVDYTGATQIVKPWDWMHFNLDQAGSDSAISAREVNRGGWAGLTTSTEKVDAISVKDYWNTSSQVIWRYISTVGTASVPKQGGGVLKPADEDVFLITENAATGWTNSAFFDGSRVPGLAGEDVCAATYRTADNLLLLTIVGTGNIAGHPVSQKDIFWINPSSQTWGGIAWHGPDHGWNYSLDAID